MGQGELWGASQTGLQCRFLVLAWIMVNVLYNHVLCTSIDVCFCVCVCVCTYISSVLLTLS